MQWKKRDKKEIAEESSKTKKAREKLKKQLEEIAEQITPQALAQKTLEIHRWIARHAEHRVILKNKNVRLFDENQNTAKVSSRIATLAATLTHPPKKVEESGAGLLE